MTHRQHRHGRIELVQGDITAVAADAIVNAANPQLAGGGGVDGAIHRAAGPALLAASQAFPALRSVRCPTGEVRATKAFALQARWVLHGVGPIYERHAPEEAERLLRSVHRRALRAAQTLGARTVAFPAISCGVYGYPLEDAAEASTSEVGDFLEAHFGVERVTFVLFGARAFDAFARALRSA